MTGTTMNAEHSSSKKLSAFNAQSDASSPQFDKLSLFPDESSLVYVLLV